MTNFEEKILKIFFQLLIFFGKILGLLNIDKNPSYFLRLWFKFIFGVNILLSGYHLNIFMTFLIEQYSIGISFILTYIQFMIFYWIVLMVYFTKLFQKVQVSESQEIFFQVNQSITRLSCVPSLRKQTMFQFILKLLIDLTILSYELIHLSIAISKRGLSQVVLLTSLFINHLILSFIVTLFSFCCEFMVYACDIINEELHKVSNALRYQSKERCKHAHMMTYYLINKVDVVIQLLLKILKFRKNIESYLELS